MRPNAGELTWVNSTFPVTDDPHTPIDAAHLGPRAGRRVQEFVWETVRASNGAIAVSQTSVLSFQLYFKFTNYASREHFLAAPLRVLDMSSETEAHS